MWVSRSHLSPVDVSALAIVSKAEREQAEARWLAAAEMFVQKVPQPEIARRLGVTATAVRTWHKRWLVDGVDGLGSRGRPGYPPLLNEAQCAELVGVLNAGPAASGFRGGWTIARVATVIRRRFGVLYRYPSAVWTLLHRLGFSPQKPARRAVERDEQAINRWREHTWSQVLEWPPPAGRGSAAPTSPVSA
jgi:transposase